MHSVKKLNVNSLFFKRIKGISPLTNLFLGNLFIMFFTVSTVTGVNEKFFRNFEIFSYFNKNKVM